MGMEMEMEMEMGLGMVHDLISEPKSERSCIVNCCTFPASLPSRF